MSTPPAVRSASPVEAPVATFCARHLRFGWGSLLVFLTLGIALEALHGFKVGSYLNATHATRRLLWTLAHSHGTLLGLVHIAFAVTIPHLVLAGGTPRRLALASRLLRSATVLLPGGFFLGGAVFHEGDPGLGILLVPVGALALLLGVALVFGLSRRS
jgi:hypothetical protein